MGFFETLLTWLNAQLAIFIGQSVARVAGAIEPAVIALATVYVMVWGYLQLSGRINEPLLDGAKRIALLALVIGASLRLWLFNDVLVDTFYRAPGQLAAAILGAPSPLGIVDTLWLDGQGVAQSLLTQASVLHWNFEYILAAFAVYLIVGLTCIYTTFLIALSLIAIAILLALAPIFVVLLLFDATRRLFESWIAQLATYGLVSILVALVGSLLLTVVRAYATAAVASGNGVTIAESVRLCTASALILLVMRQILPIAGGLGSGVALSTFNVMSRALGRFQGSAGRTGYLVGRGAIDRESVRTDPLRRRFGHQLSHAVPRLVRAQWQRRQEARSRRQQGSS